MLGVFVQNTNKQSDRSSPRASRGTGHRVWVSAAGAQIKYLHSCVCKIALSVSLRHRPAVVEQRPKFCASIAGAACQAWGWTGGLAPVAPPGRVREWAPWAREVSGGWGVALMESGTCCCTWPRPQRPPWFRPRCRGGSGGRSRARGTFSVRPNSFLPQPGAPNPPPSAASTSSWKSDQNTANE